MSGVCFGRPGHRRLLGRVRCPAILDRGERGPRGLSRAMPFLGRERTDEKMPGRRVGPRHSGEMAEGSRESDVANYNAVTTGNPPGGRMSGWTVRARHEVRTRWTRGTDVVGPRENRERGGEGIRTAISRAHSARWSDASVRPEGSRTETGPNRRGSRTEPDAPTVRASGPQGNPHGTVFAERPRLFRARGFAARGARSPVVPGLC